MRSFALRLRNQRVPQPEQIEVNDNVVEVGLLSEADEVLHANAQATRSLRRIHQQTNLLVCSQLARRWLRALVLRLAIGVRDPLENLGGICRGYLVHTAEHRLDITTGGHGYAVEQQDQTASVIAVRLEAGIYKCKN